MRVSVSRLNQVYDLKKIFNRLKPEVLVPPRPLRIIPERKVKSSFVDAANLVLSKHGLTTIPNSISPLPEQSWEERTLPQYNPVICEPKLQKFNMLKLQVSRYLPTDLSVLNNPNLPYLPSRYTKSPNYEPVEPETPFVQTANDIKGILAPFMKINCISTIPYQFHSKHFALKFIPTTSYVAAVRKSRPSMVVTVSVETLFNEITDTKSIPTKLIKSTYYPSRSAVLRSQTRKFYKNLFFEYIQSQRELGNELDGILVVKCYKLPHTDADKEIIKRDFYSFMSDLPKRRPPKPKYIDTKLLKYTCKINGLSYDNLFGRFNL